MRIHCGSLSFDGEELPIAVELEPKDRENIANMHPEAHFYCVFPEEHGAEWVREWLGRLDAERTRRASEADQGRAGPG